MFISLGVPIQTGKPFESPNIFNNGAFTFLIRGSKRAEPVACRYDVITRGLQNRYQGVAQVVDDMGNLFVIPTVSRIPLFTSLCPALPSGSHVWLFF